MLVLVLASRILVESFVVSSRSVRRFQSVVMCQESDVEQTDAQKTVLKRKLLGLCAVTDRGFGALPNDRKAVDDLVQQLSALSDSQPTRNLYPNNSDDENCLIEGSWKLVYTTALDVLSLGASPFTLLQGIYQIIKKNGDSVNIIDLAPRIQAAFPPSIVGLGTTLRLKVFTSAYARDDARVGLTFRRVEAAPLNLFGRTVASVFPAFKADLPQATLFGSNMGDTGVMGTEGPGYFDVLFLDDDCLIIAQNAPGGIFISVKDDQETEIFM